MDFREIVFENRNKDYGVYMIRKKYFRTLAISFSITLAIVFLLVVSYFTYQFILERESENVKTVLYMPSIELEAMNLPPPEDFKEEMLPPAPKVEDTPQVPVVSDSAQNKATVQKEKKTEVTDSTSQSEKDLPGVAGGEGDSLFNVPVEKFAEFPGGQKALMDYLQKNIRVFKNPKLQGIKRFVLISFLVDKTGEVKDVKVEKTTDPRLAEECIRVVSGFPKWLPATYQGRPWQTRLSLPLNFP